MKPGADEDPVTWIEAEEFARGHIGPGERPVEPRPAATIILAREGSEPGFDVLLLRRPETSRFAAGAYVFPGGVIDPVDADPALRRRLGVAGDREPAALAAALRELFEETGILLADDSPPAEAVAREREALLADRTDFAGVGETLDLSFRELAVVYFARWITPETLTRRYDTRFFLARNRGGEPSLTREHTAAVWIRPEDAVQGLREGRLPMLYPTWKTLAVLARFGTLREALAALSRRDVRPILARLERREGRITPAMSPDPLYDV